MYFHFKVEVRLGFSGDCCPRIEANSLGIDHTQYRVHMLDTYTLLLDMREGVLLPRPMRTIVLSRVVDRR